MRSSDEKGLITIPIVITVAAIILLSGFYIYSRNSNSTNTSQVITETNDPFNPINPNSSVHTQNSNQDNQQPSINYPIAGNNSSNIQSSSTIRTYRAPTTISSGKIFTNTQSSSSQTTYTYSSNDTIYPATSSPINTTSYVDTGTTTYTSSPVATTSAATTTKKTGSYSGSTSSSNSSSNYISNYTTLATMIQTGMMSTVTQLAGSLTSSISSQFSSSFSGSSFGGSGSSFGGSGSSGGSKSYFGGDVTQTTQCTCGDSTLLYINDVSGSSLQLLYQPGQSTLYDHENYQVGSNVMGSYTQGGTCEVYRGEECESEGNPNGTIDMIGTSE